MSGQKSFSLTVVIIIFALLAIFIGYLLGNWLLQLVTGGPDEPYEVTEPELPPIEREETVEDPAISEQDFSGEEEYEDEQTAVPEKVLDETGYAVQVGAFEDYGNALALMEELENDGFEPVIVSEDPYRVQLGEADNRSEAESVLEDLIGSGYEAFITH